MTWFVKLMALAGLLLWLAAIPRPACAAATPAVSYNREVRPILSQNCFFCHGPDVGRRKAKLRLDIREVALNRKAFVPSQPEASELIRRIFSTNSDERMPPEVANKT